MMKDLAKLCWSCISKLIYSLLAFPPAVVNSFRHCLKWALRRWRNTQLRTHSDPLMLPGIYPKTQFNYRIKIKSIRLNTTNSLKTLNKWRKKVLKGCGKNRIAALWVYPSSHESSLSRACGGIQCFKYRCCCIEATNSGTWILHTHVDLHMNTVCVNFFHN